MCGRVVCGQVVCEQVACGQVVCEQVVCGQVVCEQVVCVQVVCEQVVCGGGGGGGGRRRRAGGGGGIQNQKQEPHTKMWGKMSEDMPDMNARKNVRIDARQTAERASEDMPD